MKRLIGYLMFIEGFQSYADIPLSNIGYSFAVDMTINNESYANVVSSIFTICCHGVCHFTIYRLILEVGCL